MPRYLPVVLKEGIRMARRARRVRRDGFHQHKGTPEETCKAIIDRAYDKRRGYFRVSTGNFCEFYSRDFGLSCEALQELGYGERVKSTLAYALSHYESAGKVTTAIDPRGVPFDYFLPAGPDALGFLLYAITHTGNNHLAAKHNEFLQRAIDRAAEEFVDPKTLLPRADRHFSSIRDQARRKGACYDAVMIAVIAREAHRLGFRFPYKEHAVTKAIIKAYWNGTYFFQDLTREPIVTGDANVFPFWTGIVKNKRMMEDAIDAVRAAGLDDPFPLRYVSELDAAREKTSLHIVNLLSKDYESHSIWMHLGLAYLRMLMKRDADAARRHLKRYGQLIRQHRTFLEVYDTTGEPFMRTFYAADESMVWCANWLVLTRNGEDKT
ncbi:TPA: hypothetical protein HA251_07400 [Candidatus Woesearchaeota archaeon]|nr:hypothetical protein [Candidatus Woesearchaeota archaeon]